MGGGPEAGSWWKRLTKDRGLNGMDGIPKNKQHGGPDDSSDDEANGGRNKEPWEKNALKDWLNDKMFAKKGKKEEKEEDHHEEDKPEKDDGMSEK